MPLLKGRQYPQVKPLSRKNISQSDKVYVIAHTDEEFLSKEEYDKRVALYEEQVWTCQCTGAVKLTHREALESEKNILQMLKEEFPPVFEKAVLEVVHHSTHALEQLIDEAYRKLHESLVIGESVSLKVSSASKQIKGTVQKVDSTHSAAKADKKESSEDTDGVKRSPPKLLPHMYSIKIDGEEKTINGIPASDLQRITKVPRKDLLKFFIRAHAVRASTHPNSPWVVNSNLVQKFSLVNRFNSFLTGGKAAYDLSIGLSETNQTRDMPANVMTSVDYVLFCYCFDQPNGKENAESCPQKRKRSVSSNDQKPAKKQRQDSSADEKNKGSTSKTDSTKKSQTVPSKSPSTSGVKKSLWPLKTESKTGGKNSKESNDLSSEGSGDIKSRENGIVINDDDSDDDDEGASASAAKVSKSLNNSSNDGKKSKEDKKNGKSTPKKKRKSEEAGDKSLDKKKASISKEKSGTKKGSPKKEAKVVLYRLADSSGKKSPDKKMKQVTLYQLVSKKSEQSGSKTPTKTKKPKSDDDSPRYSLVKKTPSKNKSPREDDDSVKYSLVKKTPSKTPSKSPNKTPAKADGTNSAVKKTPLKPPQPAIVIMLQKAKKEGNKMKIAQLIARCAKELSDKQIKSLPSDVSEEVNKKYAAVQEKRKIEKMTPEEKEAYLQKKKEEMKQRVKENLKRKWEESKKRYEDTELDLVALPVPKIVTTPDGIANELFGSVVMVTEFIHCYKSLLTPEDKTVFTADELMLALDKGQAGFSFVAEVICILLQTLLQDQLAEDYKELKVPLSQLAVNEYTCTELLRLCLRKKDSAQDDDGTSSQASDSTDAFSEDAEVPEGLIDQLESCEMYELDIESQICLLVGLCHRVMGTYSLQEYMEEKQQDAAELWKKKIAGLKDINDQKKREKKQKKEKADQQQESEKPNQSSDNKGTLTISSFYGTASTSTEETNSAADDDMMSAIKNRRQNSNRLAGLEERKQKEEEKRLVKEKELQEYRVLKDKEAFEKQFKAGIQMGKKVFRLSPLGTDRQHNRYWFFSTTKPGIYIEKGWAPDEIDYCVGSDSRSADSDESSEDDDEEVDQANAAEKISRTVVEKTIPHKGQNLWFLLDTVADFEKLLEGLHPLGARESVLKTRLMKEKEDIIKALSSSKTSESAAAKEKEEMDFVEGFRTELLDTETKLSCGGLGGVPDLDKWEERLKKADSIPVFAKLLAETKQHTMEKFLHGMLSETGNVKKSSKESQEDSGNEPEEENTPKSNGVEMWLEALNQCSTYSRLHVLLGMLDSCINWDKSVENVKCRICRKKGREDDHLLLCDECNQPFHLFCLRPALLEIPIGEWFCASCSHERPVRRAREVAKISSAMNEDSEEEEEEEDEGIADLEHDEDCIMCGGTDNLVPCSTCTSVFHIDCHDPPLRRPPRANTWKCMQCRTGQRIIKKNSKGRASNKSSSSRRKPVVKADEDDDDDDDDYSPSEKRKRATRPEQKGRRNVRRVADSTDDSSEEESPAPSRSRNSSKTRKPDNNRTSQKRNIPESSGKTQNGIDKAVVIDIINRLMKHRSSWPFQEPVDPEEVPDYHKLVKEPMDLQTMRDRCLSDVYTKPQHFINDFSLMMKNAEQYNQENSAVSKCIQPLEKYFESCLNRHFPQCKYQSTKST